MSMNSDLSPEEPEIRTQNQTLSPVSPKPLHFPPPESIPVLENQMDPVFNDTATHIQPSDAPQAAIQGTKAPPESTHPLKQTVQNDMELDGMEPGADTTATASNDYTNSVDPASSGTIDSQDPSNQSHTLPSEGGSAPIQAVSAPFDFSATENSEAAAPDVGGNHDAPTGITGQQNGEAPSELYPIPFGDGVNIQALLDNLSASMSTAPPTQGITAINAADDPDAATILAGQPSNADISLAGRSSASLPQPANLPPRPQTQADPTAPSAYDMGSNNQSYQAVDQAQPIQSYAAPPGTSYVSPPNLPPPPLTAGAPGTSLGANSLPPPPLATFQQTTPTNQPQPSPLTTNYPQRDTLDRQDSEIKPDDELPWGSDVQKIYDGFLQDERHYVTEGQWDKFPLNSRLFIGNLPTEKVTKRDLFHVFHKHGKLAQISIKQAYGFIQFLDAESCYRALQTEQGMSVRGRKMHLEISKPQKNTRKSDGGDNKRNRRSRSPDYTRGGTSGNQGGRTDRYRGGRDRGHNRGRDDYRPGRSPSPGRHRPGRSPDRYNGRRRSRSRSPYGRRGLRSPSPRRDLDDGLPLPRRAPQDVPDVQIIVIDNLDRAFTEYVERSFKQRAVQCNVLILSPKLSEPAVVRRQIVEGVTAVMKLNRLNQITQKFSLQVFDRAGGVDNVRFEEYSNLDLHICVELVLNKKRLQPPPSQSYNDPAAYTTAQFGLPPAGARPQLAPGPLSPQANLPNVITQMDHTSLQRLLGQLQPAQTPQHPHQAQQQTQPATDLSRLLSGINPQSSYQQPQQQPQQQPGSPFDLAALLGSTRPQQPQTQSQPPPQRQAQPEPDMQSILAQLGKYRQ